DEKGRRTNPAAFLPSIRRAPLFLGLGGLLLRRGLLLGGRRVRLFLVFGIVGEQRLAADMLVGDLDLLHQVIDHLFLEQRRADAGQRRRIVAVELERLLLLARREAADLVVKRALQFVVADGHARLLADL